MIMKRLLSQTMQNSNKKSLTINAILNVIKQLCSIAFPLITFPYVTKTLGVDPYGQYNYTASLISYISLIAGLGITNYAIREGSRLKDNKNAFGNFINEIISLNILAVFVSYIVLFFIVIYYKDIPIYKTLLIIQGISVFFGVIGCEWLNIIYEDFAFVTIRYIVFQTVAVLLTFLLVKEPGDLIKYAIISQIAGVFANVSNVIHFRLKWNIKYTPIFKREVFSHLKYVLVLFANAVSMLIYVNSDITIIGIMRGDTEVGIYSVAVKIYTIVKQLLNAMMLVAVPRMARWTNNKQKKELDKQLNEILQGLLIFLIPAIVGLFSLSKDIIIVLSGEEYVTAYKALKVLAITLCFSTGVCFYSNLVLIPNNMEKHILRATIISALVNIVLNVIFIPMFGFIAAAYTTLLSEAVSVIYMVIVSKEKYFPSIFKHCLMCAVCGIIVFASCYIIKLLHKDHLITILLSVGLSVCCWTIYWLIIFCIKKRESGITIKSIIRKEKNGA